MLVYYPPYIQVESGIGFRLGADGNVTRSADSESHAFLCQQMLNETFCDLVNSGKHPYPSEYLNVMLSQMYQYSVKTSSYIQISSV